MKDILTKKFKDKNLSDSTIKLYLRNLEILNDGEPIKNFNFLKNKKDILKRLEKYKDNTRRSYLISICASLVDDPKYKKVYDGYFKLMMDKAKDLRTFLNKNEKSETQAKNWIEWCEVEEIYKKYEHEVEKFYKKKELTEKQYNTLLDYMILSLYVKHPPRRNEYQNMKVVNTYTDKLDNKYNYFDYTNKKFIFNNFKTAKVEGPKTQDVSDDLFNVINQYLRHHKYIKTIDGDWIRYTNEYLLVFQDGKPLNQVNSITRRLNGVFNKKIGSSMLRHSYLSSKYGDTIRRQKEDSNDMSHSIGTSKDYIKI